MLKTFGDIQNDVVQKLGIATTDAFYTEDIINDWINQAHRWATSLRKWPFTEGRVSTTYTTASEEWEFEGYKADSIRMITIGGKRLDKLNFEDYLLFREERPDDADRVYSDYGRLVYVNPKIDVSGTLTAYGQYTPADIDVTDHTAETVFSGGDEEGNEAIVEKVISFANERSQRKDEAEYHHEKAVNILLALEENVKDEQYNYKTHKARGGMYRHVDVVEGDYREDLFKRDQF